MNTKPLQIAALAALIVVTWGYVGYPWLNPPITYIDQEDKIAMNVMLEQVCPFLKTQYDALEVDGKIEWNSAINIIEKCEAHIQTEQFYDALVNEFGNQKYRQ